MGLLEKPLHEIFKLSPLQKKALAKLDLATAQDLIFYFPFRYEKELPQIPVGELTAGTEVVVEGILEKQKITKNFGRSGHRAEAVLVDGTGTLKILWFNQAYMAKQYKEGMAVRLRGQIRERGKNLYMANPIIENLESDPGLGPNSLFGNLDKNEIPLVAVYPSTRYISSRWFSWRIIELIKMGILNELTDPIPEDILNKYHLPALPRALLYVHVPVEEKDAESARKRFAFEEVFTIQLSRQKERHKTRESPSPVISPNNDRLAFFLQNLPFPPTNSQKEAIATISDDLASGKPMSRLLEGDVGSGKTLVAAAASYLVTGTAPYENRSARYQVAYMAPTEILAQQHFDSFVQYLKNDGLSVALITGSGCRKFPSKTNPGGFTEISRAQLLKWVAGGEIAMVVGTHALIQKNVSFKNLGLVVIDEQHRFGINQRKMLAKKGKEQSGRLPHLLSMTATPIPRTLALTIYGDLDLTLLTEMPSGRKTIITKVLSPLLRKKAYQKAKEELALGRRVFVICPRIDEPDPKKELALLAKSAKSEQLRLQKDIFPDWEVGLLHGKMKATDKEETLKDFQSGKIQILVATSVVEVGVNVPEATVMIIEGAERFGLAQLHQLRGRIARSSHQAYCFLFTEAKVTAERLKAIAKAANGFELAELDLSIRGEGTLSGNKQWGLSDLGMEGIRNIKMVEAARFEAEAMVEKDPDLRSLPDLKEKVETVAKTTHFE